MNQILEQIFPIFAVLVGALVILTLLRGLSSGGNNKKEEIAFPYQQLTFLFTPAERSFLQVLDRTVGEDYRVFGKVRCADVLKVSRGLDRSEWQKAFNRIQSKHFDYVVCRSSDFSILLAIELDDKSHSRRERVERDKFLNQAAQAAGLHLLRVKCQQSYSEEEIKEQLRLHLPGFH